jgi:hypothetical protein
MQYLIQAILAINLINFDFDLELQMKKLTNYICPSRDDLGLCSTIYNMRIHNHEHKEILIKVGVLLKNHPQFTLYQEFVTETSSTFIIRTIILNSKTINMLIAKVNGNENDFRTLIIKQQLY